MSNIGEIALYFMFVRDQLKIYHWQTKQYSRHIASDSFVDDLSTKMDTFIEVMQGSRNERLQISKNAFSFKNHDDSSVVMLLQKFKIWLVEELPSYLIPTDTELLNIRDEILADVNKTLYLFTLQ